MADRLGRPHAALDDTFVSLGGDSLSYVEISVALEGLLGRLPEGWQHRSIASLTSEASHDDAVIGAAPAPRRSRLARPWMARHLDSTIVMRAIAIIAIVGSHIPVFDLRGGAHLLIAIAGYNLARFHIVDVPRRMRVRRMWRAIATVAVPSVLWLWLVVAFSERHPWPNALLINTFAGSVDWSPGWEYWFIEALLYLLVGTTLLLHLPWVDRIERRWPFGFPLALVAIGLLARYDVLVGETGSMHLFTAASVGWLFALGWAVQRAMARWQQVVVTVLAGAVVPGFSANTDRVAFVLVGIGILIWAPTLPVPSTLVRPIAVLAGASLWIYLTHFSIYPILNETGPWAALTACLLVGVAASCAWQRLDRWSRAQWSRRRSFSRWRNPSRSTAAPPIPAMR
jgi:hypothetical protein